MPGLTPQPPTPPKPHHLVVSIVFALITTFLAVWPSWICLYPSVIFAIVVSTKFIVLSTVMSLEIFLNMQGYSLFDSHREDQRKTAKLFNSLSMGFSIAGIATFVLCVAITVIRIILIFSQLK